MTLFEATTWHAHPRIIKPHSILASSEYDLSILYGYGVSSHAAIFICQKRIATDTVELTLDQG
jgi:hypothetical protein